MFHKLKQFVPKSLKNIYHFVVGYVAALWYEFPSEKMIVIGITGTTGKTSSVFITAKLLQSLGYTVGYTSTALFGDGEKEWLNDKKMTMLGRFFTQSMLRKMVRNGCDIAIVETTSQGIVQYRHRFINYDTLVFTGIYPEHIEAHGGFENYKRAKLDLFRHLEQCAHKTLRGVMVKKTIIANMDDESVEEFLNHHSDKKMGYSLRSKCLRRHVERSVEMVRASNIATNKQGVVFQSSGLVFQTNIFGEYNVSNILVAISVARSLGRSENDLISGIQNITGIPGRMEKIECGQRFTVIVDYAFEPRSVKQLYATIEKIPHKRIIHILGSAGGGRDVMRREPLGQLAGEKASIVIVTNEDPYDDDPMSIIEDVARGAEAMGKYRNRDLFLIEERRSAIKTALHMAQNGDIVLITGKGCEQGICVKNGKILPWDDRKVIREILKKENIV